MCTKVSVSDTLLTLYNSQNLISNSSYCLPYDSYDNSLENLEIDQPVIP